MERKEQLLHRLEDIAQAVKKSGSGLALLSLGSVGQELERLDDYSDLDFFVIAKTGRKQFFLETLGWLESVQPVVFSFMNTADGHKLLFADGIFCETAVFEPHELANIPFAGARIIWQDESSQLTIPVNNHLPALPERPRSVEWLTGEILSNLYVGLGRFRRGEKLSAARFVQGYAVDRILELASMMEEALDGKPDPFDRNRRFELCYPRTAAALPSFLPGYNETPEAARAIVSFLEKEFDVNGAIKEAILTLIEG